MAVSTSGQSTAATITTVHPEDAELVSQLAKLQKMHHQIHHLRSLLPTALIGPARAAISQQSRTSPQDVAEAVIMAARQGNADIRDLQKEWHDEKTRQLFKNANAADTPQGVDAWMADYEAMASSGPAVAIKPTEEKEEDFDTPDQARSDLEKELDDKSSRLELAPGSEPGTFPVTIILDGRMKFTIDNEQAPCTYKIQAASSHRFAGLISNQLTKSGHTGSGVWKKLSQLLETLKQYKDVETSKCVQCNSIVDENLDYPLIRKAELRKEGDAEPALKWDVYHATCLKK